PRGFANGCRAMARLNAEPLDPGLGRIQAPTLVVAAELDALCPPRAGEIIAAGVPGARLVVIPGSGHQVELERPAELSQAIVSLEPDLVVAQEVCDVCAVPADDVRLPPVIGVLRQHPHSFEDVLRDVEQLAAACVTDAGPLLAGLRARIDAVAAARPAGTPL